MNKLKLLPFFISLAVLITCSASTPEMSVMSLPSLVSEGFISDTEYEIVCLGYPKQGLTGVSREESAKRAALLSAYYFANERFGSAVSPDRDGRTEKITMYDGYCEITYIITKSNLKNLKKQTEPKKQQAKQQNEQAEQQNEQVE